MTTSYRILNTSGEPRIEFNGQVFAEDELHEELWLINIELHGCYMSKRERIKTRRLIAQYEELLSALRSAEA